MGSFDIYVGDSSVYDKFYELRGRYEALVEECNRYRVKLGYPMIDYDHRVISQFCPKCGAKLVDGKRGKGNVSYVKRWMGEWLSRKCHTCGATWDELCLDDPLWRSREEK